MKGWKRVLAVAGAAVMLAALAACHSVAKDATVFIQGELDATYLGKINEEYLNVVEDMTQADAQAKYDYNLQAEGEYLLSYLGVELPTDAVYQRAEEIVGEIYSHAKYTVADAELLKSGDIAAEVTISPIEIMPLIPEEFYAETWQKVKQQAGVSDDQVAMMSDEEYQVLDEQYAMALLDKLEGLIGQITYGTDQTILLQMKEDEEGYYSLVESGMQKLDEVMIDYTGAYA
ncbi:hypothetical protein ACTQ4E_01155 [Lawsonibacter sp. LCP25S3_G6]|uniref:hypothetical protein n=1 Tax=unclassified Lawsonibacter TaxID=2617946 RepID=UPI003F9C200A